MQSDKQQPLFKPDHLHIPYQLVDDRKLEPNDRMLYGLIYWYEHLKDGHCWASNQTLAALMYTTTRAVQNSLNSLEARGYIKRLYKDKAHRNRKEIKSLVAYKNATFNERTGGDRQEVERTGGDRASEPSFARERTGGDHIKNKEKRIKKENKLPAPMVQEEKDIGEIIFNFRDVNPSYKQLFNRKPQREAARRLLQQFGMQKLTVMIGYLSTSNASRYAPTITTPSQLESKLGELKAWADKQRSSKHNAGAGVEI